VAVERFLGGSVSRQSVTDYLVKRSKGSKPLFERTRYGHYRLLRLGPSAFIGSDSERDVLTSRIRE
jgi:hypothetical protein